MPRDTWLLRLVRTEQIGIDPEHSKREEDSQKGYKQEHTPHKTPSFCV